MSQRNSRAHIEELERVTELRAQWEALGVQGRAEGWLEWSGGYQDGEWELSSNHKHPTRTVSVREDEATRTRRIEGLNEAVEQRTAARVAAQWEHLVESDCINARIAGS